MKNNKKQHKHEFKAFTILFECECGKKIAVEPSEETKKLLYLSKQTNEKN